MKLPLFLLIGSPVASLLMAGTPATPKASEATLPDTTSSSRPAVEWVAHRGASYDAPENTLSAYKLAWEQGVAAAELDVHLTKDGKLILVHDADMTRTAGQPLIVKNETAETLRKLDVGSWKDARFAGERMPLLEEALATIPDGRRMFVEVKVGAEAVPELVRVLKASGKMPEQTPVISFKLDTCIATKKAMPQVKVYYLASQKKDKQTGEWSPTNEELIALAKKHGFDGLDLSYKGPIDADFVKAAKAEGLEFLVWTVDEPADARRMIAAGVDGITSNRPLWLSQQVK